MLISIDHGNYAIKTPGNTFVSGLTEYSVRPPLARDVLEYEGSFWALTGQRISYMRDKTKDDRYFILTLFAIAKELQAGNGIPPYLEVDLAVGLPPEHFSILRERFAAYFRRRGVKFVYNDIPCCVSIQNVFVYPQAYGAVVPKADLLRASPRTFVIDIGGYTTDVLLLRNTCPDLQFCRSLEIGVITMHNDIIGKVSALYDMKIEDDHIVSVINGERTVLPEEVQNTIRSAVQHHAQDILDKLRELQVDLRSTPAIFIGGGSILFKPFIEGSPMVAKADFIPEINANAVGFGMLAAAQLKKLAPARSGVMAVESY